MTYQQTHDRQDGIDRDGVAGWQMENERITPWQTDVRAVADTDDCGRIHLAWGDTAEQVHYTRIDKPGDDANVQLLGKRQETTITTRI